MLWESIDVKGGLLIRERAPAEFLAIDFRHHSLPFLETAIRAGRTHISFILTGGLRGLCRACVTEGMCLRPARVRTRSDGGP